MARSDDILSGLIADIDRRLLVAYADLTLARARFTRSPNAARDQDRETAQSQLDELLDLRLAVTGKGDPLAAAA